MPTDLTGTQPRGAIEAAAPRLAPRVLNAATGLALAGVIAGAAYIIAASGTMRWNVIGRYLFSREVFNGIGITFLISAISLAVGLLIGVLIAVMKISHNRILRLIADLYLWFFRGTPVIIQIIFWFNIALFVPRVSLGPLTVVVNDVVTPLNAAIFALCLNVGAPMGEIIRAGILSVDAGQKEAALTLGMTPGRAMRKIILPQSVRVVLPPAGNLAIDLFKATSLAYVIGTRDILGTVQSIASQNFFVIEMLIVASIWYLAFVSLFSFLQARLERSYGRGYQH